MNDSWASEEAMRPIVGWYLWFVCVVGCGVALRTFEYLASAPPT